jgi:hypothetical protein
VAALAGLLLPQFFPPAGSAIVRCCVYGAAR